MQLIGTSAYGETPALGRQRRRKAIDNAMASQMAPGLPTVPAAPEASAPMAAPATPAAPQQPMFGGALQSAPARTLGSAAGGALMGGAVGGIPGALAGGLAGAVLQYAQRGKPSQDASNAMAHGWDGFSQSNQAPQPVNTLAQPSAMNGDLPAGERSWGTQGENMVGRGAAADDDVFGGFLRKLFG